MDALNVDPSWNETALREGAVLSSPPESRIPANPKLARFAQNLSPTPERMANGIVDAGSGWARQTISAFVITVNFRLKPGTRDGFRRHMDANARASARDEAGCKRFDVLEPAGDPDGIFLYEMYVDRPAFAEHVRSAHFAEFQEATADLVEEKIVVEYDLVCEGGANLPIK